MQLDADFLEEIAQSHGDSFYILDTDRFSQNFVSLAGAFRQYWPATSIAYSYKTNYVPRLCQIVDTLGGWAEVVSIMEYEIARRCGVSADRIFFNGPVKRRDEIERVLLGGGVVNLDADYEIAFVKEIAATNPGRRLAVGLRCNFDVGDGVVSRFGFYGADLDAALGDILAIDNVDFVGFHCHFATRSLDCWAKRTSGMLALIERSLPKLRSPLRFVSLGGGIYSGDMPPEMQAQFPVSVPTFADYAAVAAKPFAAFFSRVPLAEQPSLIIEPGTALAADSVRFATRIVSIKKVAGKWIATAAGSSQNMGIAPSRTNVPAQTYASPTRRTVPDFEGAVDVAGYTCIESDYLLRDFDAKIAVGDFLVLEYAGSYSIVMKPPFISPNVPIVEVRGERRDVRLVKRRETFDDLFQTYVF